MTAREIVCEMLRFLGVDDCELALQCDEERCRSLILSLTVASDNQDWSKFLTYMRN